jgi:D-arabinose 1-dehydrogenase-like Zn-dependent alcohol dehydrogenase
MKTENLTLAMSGKFPILKSIKKPVRSSNTEVLIRVKVVGLCRTDLFQATLRNFLLQ